MDSHTLIQALIYLGAAALIVPIAVRLGLGSVLGYLIAGCIIGPWALRLQAPRAVMFMVLPSVCVRLRCTLLFGGWCA